MGRIRRGIGGPWAAWRCRLAWVGTPRSTGRRPSGFGRRPSTRRSTSACRVTRGPSGWDGNGCSRRRSAGGDMCQRPSARSSPTAARRHATREHGDGRAVTATRDAVGLRAAALSILAGREPNWTRLQRCSAATWQLFFRTERCALALKSRLAAAGCAVPDRVRAEIERAATRELQRILSARGQLLRIGRLAAAHAIPAIVLKGGVAALASAAPVDLHDVDVLVPSHQAEQLAALLDKEGFHATGPEGTSHLSQRVAPNAVQIEVHFAIQDMEVSDATWRRARRLAGALGLSSLDAVDHLWHLLVHTVVTHPHRRGALRDVLLAAEALAGCSPAEVTEVERLIAGHPLFQPLSDVLAMARQLRGGLPMQDRFRREAAANYVLRGPLGWLGYS